MVHYGTGRLSLKGSCSIRAPEVGGAGGAWRNGVSLCCETLPQAAGSLSALETLHHPPCSGARDACSAVTPHSHSSNTLLHPHIKDKDFALLLLSVEGSNIVRLGRGVQSWKKLKIMNCLVGYIKNIQNWVPVKHASYFSSCFFFLFVLSASLFSDVCLLCSCPQENALSSAASVVPLSPRRATYCVTSSFIQGRNPSSVICAATPVAGGTPSPAIYAPTRVSMQSSTTLLHLWK